uniref:NAAA-beta domain-containing protein n=1 Tax=Pristionchus pacificus TaxID=54126 RepID=A0A2A6BQV2_PRIPA|eukprot:PDM68299.1 hypothetical protein PRIPAC_46343 [Pristionchus pacificus]
MLLLPFLFLLSTVLADRSPPRYRIQLDYPPSSRWDQIIDDHLQYLPLVQIEAAKIIPRPVQKIVWKIAENIRYFFPSDYAQELEGTVEGGR